MRSIWKGAISFGLVTIPVKLYSATEQRDVTFHQVHREDAGRIKYRRVCTLDGEEVAYSDIAKGYELPTGEVVVLTDEDFADLPLTSSKRIDVLQFVPEDEVDPIYFNKSYYLEPEANGAKPYVLLRDALEGSGKVAIVKIALRQRESLATLRSREGVFVLETMLWPDEVRASEFAFLEEDVEVRPQELKMASSLIDSMTEPFDPDQYHDQYREALEKVIEAKVEGKELVAPEGGIEDAGPAVDLMAALRASVDAAKKERASAKGGSEKADSEESSSTSSAKSSSSKAGSSKPGSSKSGSSKSASGKGEAKKSAPKKTAKKSEKKEPAKKRSA